MNLKQPIHKLQEIDAKYDRDLDIFTVAEPGLVGISNITLTYVFEEDGGFEIDEDSTDINSVLLEQKVKNKS